MAVLLISLTCSLFTFRGDMLDSVMFRMGILAAIRSKAKDGSMLIQHYIILKTSCI